MNSVTPDIRFRAFAPVSVRRAASSPQGPVATPAYRDIAPPSEPDPVVRDHYEFKTTPYKHQLEGLEASWDRVDYAFWWEMGTGKTWAAINTAGKLHTEGLINGLVVVAPKGVYQNWLSEIETHLTEDVPRRVVVWTAATTKRQKQAVGEISDKHADPNRLRIFLMNVEALSGKRGVAALKKFLNSGSMLLVVDESSSIKTPKAARTKALLACAPLAKFKRVMSGSPVTQSPMDLFSQCAVLNKNLLGFSSFYSFRNRYAITQSQSFGDRSCKVVTGYQRIDELSEKLDRFSSRILKVDCLDLPEKIYQRRLVDLTGEQQHAYESLTREAKALLSSGSQVSVTNVLAQILRLHQVACGFVKDDDGEIQSIKSNRMGALEELLDEVDGKAIIWASYRHNLQEIIVSLRAQYGPDSTVSYYGDTSQENRLRAIEQFQDNDRCRWFVGNPQSAGYGLTLTAANTVIYFSNSYRLEERLQSEDRAHRIGQHHPVNYVDLVSPGTVDEKIVGALRDKRKIASEVMGDAWKEWI